MGTTPGPIYPLGFLGWSSVLTHLSLELRSADRVGRCFEEDADVLLQAWVRLPGLKSSPESAKRRYFCSWQPRRASHIGQAVEATKREVWCGRVEAMAMNASMSMREKCLTTFALSFSSYSSGRRQRGYSLWWRKCW